MYMTTTEIIKGGKDYLQANDLDGFYEYMDKLSHGDLYGTQIGEVTIWLEEHGVNTVKYLTKIPNNYCLNQDKVPRALIHGDTISFPDTIKEIGNYAFWGCKNFKVADLRGVDEFGFSIFGESNLEEVIFDNNNPTSGRYASISGAKNLKVVKVPKDSLTYDMLSRFGEDTWTACFGDAKLETY